jgi:hypothetical protein
MGMGRLPELIWATKEGPPPTPRETAERWIKALSGSEPVDTAQAEGCTSDLGDGITRQPGRSDAPRSPQSVR